jgi:hypothetical protein
MLYWLKLGFRLTAECLLIPNIELNGHFGVLRKALDKKHKIRWGALVMAWKHYASTIFSDDAVGKHSRKVKSVYFALCCGSAVRRMWAEIMFTDDFKEHGSHVKKLETTKAV